MKSGSLGPYAETARLLMLLAAALWLAHPYFEPRLIGTGDALWYHHLLADAVTQFRAGVFPVYVGQSDYSFNGSVYPLRAAPYFQYFAGVLDLVTFHSLGFFALQHLTVVLSLVAGAWSSYGVLVWLAPQSRWSAFALALLYVACPGVAGLFHAQDLYMSGMTLPWVPLVFGATVRTFEDDGKVPLAVLSVGLAALWWAHSPIAFWATVAAALGQILRMTLLRLDARAWARALAAAAVFSILSAYPIVSVFLLRTRGEAIVPYLMDRGVLLRTVADSFPGSLLPIDLHSSNLSFLQLGYSLWGCLLASVVVLAIRPRVPAIGYLIGVAAFFLILVFPVGRLTAFLWRSFPETIVGMTLYWPMQRFYILIAAATVVATQRGLFSPPFSQRIGRATPAVVLVCMGFWSCHESSKLIEKALLQTDAAQDGRIWSLPENVAVQRHTYGLFARRPGYFSHGVVDPYLETRLLDPATESIVASDYDQARTFPFSGEFKGSIDANPGILDLKPSLVLEPGEKYFLTFAFEEPETKGLLQIVGPHFYREYVLPVSGEAKSFGSGPSNNRSLVLWTSGAVPEEIKLHFVPTSPKEHPSDFVRFSKFSFHEIDRSTLPIQVNSLIPYTAMIESAKDALLETPRMFVPGYEAVVNSVSVPVRKSREGLVEFPVPSGQSHVTLRFVGPFALRAAFWASALGWVVAVGWFCLRVRANLAQRLSPCPSPFR